MSHDLDHPKIYQNGSITNLSHLFSWSGNMSYDTQTNICNQISQKKNSDLISI